MAEQIESKRVAFLKWLEENDFKVNPKVELRYSGPEFGYTVHATGPLKSGEILFQVPQDAQLSFGNSDIHDKLKPKDRKEIQQHEDEGMWTGLILAMLYENAQPHTRWRPYLDILPETISVPAMWSEEDQLELKGTSIESVAEEEEERKSMYEDILLPLLQKYPALFPKAETNPLFSYDMFKRMGSIIGAYSFTNEFVAMTPMADMLNHATGKNNARLYVDDEAEIDSDDDSANQDDADAEPAAKRRKTSEDAIAERNKQEEQQGYSPFALKMRATRDIAAGEELYNTYGDLPTLALLEKYGYVEPDIENPHDEVIVTLNQALEAFKDHLASAGAKEQQELFEEKLTFMRENGILQDPEDDSMDDEEDEEDDGEPGAEYDFPIYRPKATAEEGEPKEPLGGILNYIAQVFATSKDEFEEYKAAVEKSNKEEEAALGINGDDSDEDDEPKQKKNPKASKKRARDAEDDEDDEEDDEMDEDAMAALIGRIDNMSPQPLVDVKVSNEGLVNSLLKAALQARLARFETSLEADEKLLKENNFRSKHHRMAVIARVQEKKFLNSLLATL